ncbi:MAG: hypothetical protein NC183_07060 [Corallococcus sp.]|nr:hypothetical protein [Corallococcus sp.]
MQWRTNRGYQDVITQDVYSDVKTSFGVSDSVAQKDVQEYDLATIQEKLGMIDAQVNAEVAVSTPDTMPSSQTLNMNFERQYSAQTKTNTKFSTQTKVMAAGYIFIVLALIVAVTLCGVSVSGSFGTAALLNTEYTAVAAQVDELTAQVQAEDYAALIAKATELGYIDASNTNTLTYTEIETRPAQNLNIQTNWFDSLCDWFSNAFGG